MSGLGNLGKNLIVDLDGTIVTYDFPKMIKRYFGVPILPEWVWCYSLTECLGLPEKEVAMMFREEMYAAPLFIPGVIDTLGYLRDNDYTIFIYSNRIEVMGVGGLGYWLINNGVPFDQLVTGDCLPAAALAAIDDSPAKLLSLAGKVHVDKLILFQQPWNQSCHDIQDRFRWVNNWEDIRGELNDR